MGKKKNIGVIGSGNNLPGAAEIAKMISDREGAGEGLVIGSTMNDYYELHNIIRDLPTTYHDENARNESKHKATCAKNRAKRKNKKRKRK